MNLNLPRFPSILHAGSVKEWWTVAKNDQMRNDSCGNEKSAVKVVGTRAWRSTKQHNSLDISSQQLRVFKCHGDVDAFLVPPAAGIQTNTCLMPMLWSLCMCVCLCWRTKMRQSRCGGRCSSSLPPLNRCNYTSVFTYAFAVLSFARMVAMEKQIERCLSRTRFYERA